MKNIKTLSDQLLVTELKEQVRKEREATAEVIRYLHEVDKRRLYLGLGYSSLYSFCTEGLGYSGGAAYRRIQAARCLSATPELADKLESGALTLCAVSEVARVPEERRTSLFSQSEGKTKLEVAKIVAQHLPAVKARRESVNVSKISIPAAPLFTSTVKEDLKFTVTLEFSKEEFELLEEVQRLSGSAKKSIGIVKALKLYQRLKSPKARELRISKRKGTSTVKVLSRHVPVATRDKVLMRDGSQCCFRAQDGKRCQETTYLQIDHIKPYSLGGEHSEENLRVLCGAHNRLMYERVR